MSTTVSSLHIGLRWSSQVAGGADRVFADLASTLPAAGVPFVGVVAGKEQLSRETDGLIYSFAPEDSRTTTRLLGARRNIPKLIEQHNPDVIASHFALYTFPALHHIRSRPFVMHFHGPWAMDRASKELPVLQRTSCAGSKKLSTPSHHEPSFSPKYSRNCCTGSMEFHRKSSVSSLAPSISIALRRT